MICHLHVGITLLSSLLSGNQTSFQDWLSFMHETKVKKSKFTYFHSY